MDYVRNKGGLADTYTEEEIHRVIGIFSINSLAVELGEDCGEEMGFYPTFSNINHSCIANCKVVKLANKAVEVRAKVGIPRGEEITIQYVTELQPTRARRGLLSRKWFFHCTCPRCSDPTECQTLLSALQCPSPSLLPFLLP